MLTLDDFLDFYGLAECRWTGTLPGEAGAGEAPSDADDGERGSGGEAGALEP